MSCPLPGDMDKCDQKCRCPCGPCAGVVYTCKEPCDEGFTFDDETCECIDSCGEPATVTVEWKVSYATYAGNCSSNTRLCFSFGDNPYSRQFTDVLSGSNVTVGTQGTGVIGTCSGSENTQVVATYISCETGSPAFKTEPLGAPGCSVNTSAGALASPYDVNIIYE